MTPKEKKEREEREHLLRLNPDLEDVGELVAFKVFIFSCI